MSACCTASLVVHQHGQQATTNCISLPYVLAGRLTLLLLQWRPLLECCRVDDTSPERWYWYKFIDSTQATMSPTACGANVGKTDGRCTPIDSYGVHPYDALSLHAFIYLQCSCHQVAMLNLPPVQPLRCLLITITMSKVLQLLICWGQCRTYLTVNPYVQGPLHHPPPVNCH